VKDKAIKKMTGITMAMAELTTNRLLKNPVKVEFTRIYISFTTVLQEAPTQVRTFDK
jgi:hypothetical protein